MKVLTTDSRGIIDTGEGNNPIVEYYQLEEDGLTFRHMIASVPDKKGELPHGLNPLVRYSVFSVLLGSKTYVDKDRLYVTKRWIQCGEQECRGTISKNGPLGKYIEELRPRCIEEFERKKKELAYSVSPVSDFNEPMPLDALREITDLFGDSIL